MKQRRKRAFVVGNAVLDESFAVAALPQEGSSVLAQRRAAELGGKGANQAVVMARCGVPVTLIAAVGGDTRADVVRAALATESLDVRLVVQAGAATDLSIILTDRSGGNVVVTTAECAHSLDAAQVLPLLGDAQAGDLMVLQGNLSALATVELMAWAAARGLVIVVNPSPVDIEFAPLLGQADTVFLNRPEAQTLTGATDALAAQALHDMGVTTVVLTQGTDGALLSTRAGATQIAAIATQVIDPTGAGDTFQAVALAAALRAGHALCANDLALAAKAAALTVSRPGTSTAFPSAAELGTLLADRAP